jgi:uncharacterized protein (TIGR02722 family)
MKKVFFVLGAILLLSSCTSDPKVIRMDAVAGTGTGTGTRTAAPRDLSGNWNDQDVKIVCEALINDCLNSPRVSQALAAMGGKKPVVLVGTFRNDSREHIDTSIISSRMETAIFNSGKMDFVAGGSTRTQRRAERQDQLLNASEETAAALGYETGADFMLFGSVKSIVDRSGNQTLRTYQVFAEMTDVETNQRIWMGENTDIKKLIVRPRNRL